MGGGSPKGAVLFQKKALSVPIQEGDPPLGKERGTPGVGTGPTPPPQRSLASDRAQDKLVVQEQTTAKKRKRDSPELRTNKEVNKETTPKITTTNNTTKQQDTPEAPPVKNLTKKLKETVRMFENNINKQQTSRTTKANNKQPTTTKKPKLIVKVKPAILEINNKQQEGISNWLERVKSKAKETEETTQQKQQVAQTTTKENTTTTNNKETQSLQKQQEEKKPERLEIKIAEPKLKLGNKGNNITPKNSNKKTTTTKPIKTTTPKTTNKPSKTKTTKITPKNKNKPSIKGYITTKKMNEELNNMELNNTAQQTTSRNTTTSTTTLRLKPPDIDKITPVKLTIKVKGTPVNDLKSFLARKKLERDSRQAQKHNQPVDQNIAAEARIQTKYSVRENIGAAKGSNQQ